MSIVLRSPWPISLRRTLTKALTNLVYTTALVVSTNFAIVFVTWMNAAAQGGFLMAARRPQVHRERPGTSCFRAGRGIHRRTDSQPGRRWMSRADTPRRRRE